MLGFPPDRNPTYLYSELSEAGVERVQKVLKSKVINVICHVSFVHAFCWGGERAVEIHSNLMVLFHRLIWFVFELKILKGNI